MTPLSNANYFLIVTSSLHLTRTSTEDSIMGLSGREHLYSPEASRDTSTRV